MQKPDSLADADLLAAIARRDGDAFEVFYRRHLPTVLAFLTARIRDPEVAADLAAEVFAAVLTSAHRYRPVGATALPWLFTIAQHKLKSSLRRHLVESKARRRLGYEPVALEDEDLVRVEELAAVGRVRLDELIGALPEDQRVALLAHVVEDQSYAEVAARLRTSELVIRKRVSRGLARLRSQLEEDA